MVFAKCAECTKLVDRGFFVECSEGLSPFKCGASFVPKGISMEEKK